ncbi:MAG TPA: S41 family peptidase [Candidatus Saccharimonadales bacterium]|nr:S41 family peptidase [Candidatus Saccharimonadales bacterium]
MADEPTVAESRPPAVQHGIKKSTFFLTLALVLVVGFVAGTRSNDIFAAVGPVLGIKVASGSIDLNAVEKTYRELASNYDGTLDSQKLIDGASRGMVAAAGDKYTVFMDAKEATAFDDDLSGNIGGGIGAEIGVRSGQPTILRVLADNPAEKAGLRAGDVITKVNDESANGWSASEAADKIRGDVGTTVKVAIARGSEQKDFTVKRESVTNPSVYSKVENGIGTLTISRFDAETGSLARKAAEDFKAQNVKGVILDLRNNGGGYLTAAQDVAGLWLDNQVVVSERSQGKVVDELRSGSNPILGSTPTVLLVNGSSASASEIVAGALKDYGKATLIGEKTFGKGTVQKVLDLGAGTKLKVTVARWYTPKGQNITEQGIEPNEKVELSDADANAGKDPQLDAALKKLEG